MLTPVGRNRRPVLRRPAILMSRVPAVAGEGRTILHEESQPVLFGDFQVIDPLREHSLIEFIQPSPPFFLRLLPQTPYDIKLPLRGLRCP